MHCKFSDNIRKRTRRFEIKFLFARLDLSEGAVVNCPENDFILRAIAWSRYSKEVGGDKVAIK